MLVNKKNYNKLLTDYQSENERLCEDLIRLFSSLQSGKFNIASVGNSIASGYSKCDEMIPFLMRSDLVRYDSDCDLYSYARVRRNEEYNIIKWYKSNISHQEINKLLLGDILAKVGKYACFGEEQLKAYEQMTSNSNIGLADFVRLDNNIIIYNGLTGSFTDRIRKGNMSDKLRLLSSFSEDFETLKSLLLQIYIDNPNVQIYVCGIPNMLGLGVSSSYDKYLIRALKTIPNAKYVKAPSHNVLLKLEGQKEIDIHYNRPEYLALLNSVFKEILVSYIPLKIKNKILERIALYSHENELQSTISRGTKQGLEKVIQDVLTEYEDMIHRYDVNLSAILDEVYAFYDRTYLLNYPCTDRVAMKEIIKKIKHQ